jgi:hypothetical protein
VAQKKSTCKGALETTGTERANQRLGRLARLLGGQLRNGVLGTVRFNVLLWSHLVEHTTDIAGALICTAVGMTP